MLPTPRLQAKLARHAQQGLSLLECLLFCLILGVLLAQALPALRDAMLRQRLLGSAQTLMTDLQQARAESVRSGAAVQFRISSHAGGSCYVLHTGATGACRCDEGGTAVCTGDAALLKSQWFPLSRAVGLRANVASLGFQARQGAVTNTGSIDVQIGDGIGIRQVVSVAGRVRSCAINGRIGGLQPCQA